MVKLVVILVVGVIAFVAVGLFVESSKRPALPAATSILPPTGAIRLMPEMTPAMILLSARGAGSPAGAAAAATSTNPNSIVGDYYGVWIPERGWGGDVKGVKRDGANTRIGFEITDPTSMGVLNIVAIVPGDPGEVKVGADITVDGWISDIYYRTLPRSTATLSYIELSDATVLRVRNPRY